MGLFSLCSVSCRQMAAGEKVWSNSSSSGKFAFKPRQFHCSMCLLLILRIVYFMAGPLGTRMATRFPSLPLPSLIVSGRRGQTVGSRSPHSDPGLFTLLGRIPYLFTIFIFR